MAVPKTNKYTDRARLAMADDNPDTRESKLRNIRRRLFCDDAQDNKSAKDEMARQFAEERARHQEEKKTKWNFDFKKEQPMEGQWQWERVDKTNGKKTSSGAGAQDAPATADASNQRIRVDAQRQAL